MPYNVFVHRDTLESAVNSALIELNEGSCGINDVLKEFGMLPVVLNRPWLRQKDSFENEKYEAETF